MIAGAGPAALAAEAPTSTLPPVNASAPTGPPLAVIVGPTGAGKSRLAIDLAAVAGGEVVSADSQQVYRGMDIGTGKVSAAERRAVPHHVIDVIEPDQEMTAARFVELADAAIAAAAARGAPVVVAGGTGLYVRALLLGLFAGPAGDPELRARLTAEAASAGGGAGAVARLARSTRRAPRASTATICAGSSARSRCSS